MSVVLSRQPCLSQDHLVSTPLLTTEKNVLAHIHDIYCTPHNLQRMNQKET